MLFKSSQLPIVIKSGTRGYHSEFSLLPCGTMSKNFLVTSYITHTILLNSLQVNSEHEWSVKKACVFNKSFTYIIITRNNQRRDRCRVFQVSDQRSKCSGSNAGVLHTVHMIIGQNACDQNSIWTNDTINFGFLL